MTVAYCGGHFEMIIMNSNCHDVASVVGHIKLDLRIPLMHIINPGRHGVARSAAERVKCATKAGAPSTSAATGQRPQLMKMKHCAL